MGREEGREEGLAKGREEGEIIGRADAIRKMASAGMSVEQISSILELDIDEVRRSVSACVQR